MSRLTAMGEMASTLAHELNQPLSAIANYLKGCSRLLETVEHRRTSPKIRDALDEAAEQALRAGEIIRRLREFVARGETEQRAENITSWSRKQARWLWWAPRSTGVRVRFASTPQSTSVLVDKVQIQQVLLNLMRNAIEPCRIASGRELLVATAATATTWSRSASPIPGPACRRRSPISCSSRSSRPSRTAWGSACRSPARSSRRMAGSIWVEPNPGGGTVFRFTLPACRREALPMAD